MGGSTSDSTDDIIQAHTNTGKFFKENQIPENLQKENHFKEKTRPQKKQTGELVEEAKEVQEWA